MARSVQLSTLGRTVSARFAKAVVGAAAITCFATPAGAADTRQGKMPSTYQQLEPAATVRMMDADKDGFVTREEFVKFQENLFDKIDKDRDRRMAAAEFTDQG